MKDKLAKTTGDTFVKLMKEQNEGKFPLEIRVDRVGTLLTNKSIKILDPNQIILLGNGVRSRVSKDVAQLHKSLSNAGGSTRR